MKEALELIHRLQGLNRQAEELRLDAEALAADLANQERQLQEKKRRAEQAHQQRLDALRHADATQLKIQEAEGEVARLKGQLNVTKNQKEYDAIRRGILSRQADVQKWEDEGLELLQAADELAKDEARLREEVAQAEQALSGTKDQMAIRRAEIERHVAKLQSDSDCIRRAVNQDVLSAYDRLTGHHHSRALAQVKDRICQGCFTRITKQTENLLMRGDEIVYCHSCGRMLMLAS